MNKKTIKTFLAAVMAVFAFPSFLFSQEGEALKWGGYVKVDMFNDSRAVVGFRDDMLALYPAERKQITKAPDALKNIAGTDAAKLYVYANKEDLNAVKQTSITTVETRINLTINAPDAFGAKVKGFIEGDFFGAANTEIFNFYLRHANVTFDWGSSKLLVGQWWHPLFAVGYQPLTVQFSPLIIIHPFNRSPQISYTQNLGGGLSLTLAAIYQGYHTSTGPTTPPAPNTAPNSVTTTDGYGSRFKRWADKPDIDLQLLYKSDMFDIGLTLDLNEVRPYDNFPVYDSTITADRVGNNKNKVTGLTKQIFGKFVFDKDNNGHVRFAYLQGENTHHLVMLGGYAQKGSFVLDNLTALGLSTAEANLVKAFTPKEYTPIKVVSYWIQPIWGKDIEYAVALGKIENKGAKEDINLNNPPPNQSFLFYRGTNIKSITHVIPQVKFKSGKTEFGVMLGYFEAEYMEDDKGYKLVTQYINTEAGIAVGTINDVNNYNKINIGGFEIPNPAVRDSKGVIGDTYKVVDYRLQASVKQAF
jgi:hypothetical protein